MKELAQEGFTHDRVKDALMSNRQIQFEYELLDKQDRRIGTIDDVNGSYSFNSEAQIKGAGRFVLNEKNLREIDFLSERIKPLFCLKIGSKWIKWSQGIYLISSPDREERNGGVYRSIDAYDKSLILMEDKVDNRYLITAGTLYTDAIRTLLISAGITKYSIEESSLELSVDKEFEIGTSKLDIINGLLISINYNTLWFDGNGYCMIRKYINPKDRAYEFNYETDEKSIITYGSTESIDAFNVPNKFVRYVENPETDYLISSFVNDRSSNPLSTVSRGRVITDIEAVSDIPDQVTLDQYVQRVATERSLIFGGVKFPTLPMPHHTFLDCLRVKNTTLGIAEKYIETEWSIDTGEKGLMTHKCKKVVELW
jgi:hypothetical protein